MRFKLILLLLLISISCFSQLTKYQQYNHIQHDKSIKVCKYVVLSTCAISFIIMEYGLRANQHNYCNLAGSLFIVSYSIQLSTLSHNSQKHKNETFNIK